MSTKFKVGDHVYLYDILKLGSGQQYISVYSGELVKIEDNHYTVTLGNHCFLHKLSKDRLYKTKAGALRAMNKELDTLVDRNAIRIEVSRMKDSTKIPSKMQKENIEAALQQALIDYGSYCAAFQYPQNDSESLKKRLARYHKSRNALYGAIGGMEEYKFSFGVDNE